MATEFITTYLDGEEVRGRQVPFDDVLWERHFKTTKAKLFIQADVKRAKLEAEGVPEVDALNQAMSEIFSAEHELFEAYCVCKRLRKHRDLSFDEWGEIVAACEKEVDEAPLDDSSTSGSAGEKPNSAG